MIPYLFGMDTQVYTECTGCGAQDEFSDSICANTERFKTGTNVVLYECDKCHNSTFRITKVEY